MSATAIPNLPDGAGRFNLVAGQARIKMTALQLQTLNSAPVPVLPPPGQNKVIIPIYSLLDFLPGVTPFTNANDDALLMYGNDPTTAVAATIVMGFDGTMASEQLAASGPTLFLAGNPFALDDLTNKPLFYGTNDPDALAGDGTAVLHVYYIILER